MAAHLYLMARTAETTVNVKRFSMLRHAAMEMTGTLPTHHRLMEPVTAMPIYLTNDPQWPDACRKLFDIDPPTPSDILALCKQIVALHNGTIHFTSEPGKGTRVTVDLCVEEVPSE